MTFQRSALIAPRGEEGRKVMNLAKRVRLIEFVSLLNTRMVIALDFETLFGFVIEPYTSILL